MSNNYFVRWTSIAQDDLNRIFKYISQNNIETAEKISDQIIDKVLSLKQFPFRGHIIPELQEIKIQTHREVKEMRWRIIYNVVESEVFIIAIIDERRDAKDFLLERLTLQ